MVRNVDAIVLGTINAPWKRSISAEDLITCVATTSLDVWLPHLAVFFTEVSCDLIIEFARFHDISTSQLSKCYRELKSRTGEHNDLLESRLNSG